MRPKGVELFDMEADPRQYTNLGSKPEYASVVEAFGEKLATKLQAVRNSDLRESER